MIENFVFRVGQNVEYKDASVGDLKSPHHVGLSAASFRYEFHFDSNSTSFEVLNFCFSFLKS